MTYGIRVFRYGNFDIPTIRKYWPGEIVVKADEATHQCLDMLPPSDYRGEQTLWWAQNQKKYLEEGLGNLVKIEIIEVKSN